MAHTRHRPKTADSAQTVRVPGPLRKILSRLRVESGQPASGYILQGVSGGPLNLDYLARIAIKPILELAGLEWDTYYACRRGLATLATDKTGDPSGAAGWLRHKSIETTAEHYIKMTLEATERASNAVESAYYAATLQQPKGQLVENTTRRDA